MPLGFDPVSADNIGFPEDAVPIEAKARRPTSAPAARRYDDIVFVTPDVGDRMTRESIYGWAQRRQVAFGCRLGYAEAFTGVARLVDYLWGRS